MTIGGNRFCLMSARSFRAWLGALLMGVFVGCGGGADDRKVCINTSECAENESCEEGFCQPACTPGVDCPEKDVTSEDGNSDVADDSDVKESDAVDVTDADSEDAVDAEDGADATDAGPETLSCELEPSVSTSADGPAFEVRFGERTTGVVTLPEGWVLDPVCCGAGCCQ